MRRRRTWIRPWRNCLQSNMPQIKVCVVAAMLALGFRAHAQVLRPVTWTCTARRTGPTEALLIFTATIEGSWHIHSQRVREGGPVPTRFGFDPSDDFSLAGPTTEPHPIRRLDAVFNMTVGVFEQYVLFQQRIHLWADQVTVKGELVYMACNESRCCPPVTEEFNIMVK